MTLSYDTYPGAQAPPVSPAGKGRLYFDAATNKFKVSENGGAYANLGGGGSAFGPAGYVQFSDGAGNFLGDAAFDWDTTIKGLGLGIAPTHRLDVASFDTTLAAPTAPSITPTIETAANAPTITSVTEIVGPDDATSVSGTISDPDPNGIFTADGSDWSVNVTTALLINGTYYAANAAFFDMGTDANDAQPISFPITWTQATIGSAYFVQLLQNGSPVYTAFVNGLGSASTTIDNASIPGSPGPTFASISYPFIVPATPATGPNSLAAVIVDVGSGSLGPANGTNYMFEVDSYIVAQGQKWTSNSPSATSIPDQNDGQFFDIQTTWNDGGGTTGFILRVSTDGGGSWVYQDLGYATSYPYGGFPNDPAAQARWGQAYPGVGSSLHNYAAYGFQTSPSTYYSPTNTTNTFTETMNPPTGYVLELAITYGAGTPNAKVLGSPNGDGGEAFSFGAAATIVLDGPGIWGGGATVTPTHIGFPGDGTNIVFEFFAQAISPATFYSATFATSTFVFPNDGQFRYLQVSWTPGVGSANTKILRNVAGGGFTSGQLFGGGTFQYLNLGGGSTSPSFGGGTTVTPNSIAGIAAVFSSPAASFAEQYTAAFKSSVGGGSARIAFLNNGNTEQSSFGFDGGTGFARWNSNAATWDFSGAGSTNYVRFSSSIGEFNRTGSGSYNFKVIGPGGNDLFRVSTPNASVAVGAASNIGNGVLVVEPVGIGINLWLKGGSGNFDIVRAFTVAGAQAFHFTGDGFLTIANASTLGYLNTPAGTSGVPSLFMTPGTLTSSPQNGYIEHDNSAFYFTQSGGRFRNIVGPSAGLTNNFFPIVDGNGNLVDSGLTTLGGTTFVVGSTYTSTEFKGDITLDSGKNIQMNGTGSLTMGGSGNVILSTVTGTKWGTSALQKQGWWNATPVIKGTVTGSRGANAALASLLTLLATYGLLTDSST